MQEGLKDIEDIIQVDDIGYVRKEDRAILRWSLWTSAIEWEAASRDVRKLGYDGAQWTTIFNSDPSLGTKRYLF